MADTEIKNVEVRDAGPAIFGAKTGSGQAAQLARQTMLDLAGDAVTGGNQNIFSKARPKTEAKVLPITDHNVFNCEENILESAEAHTQELTDEQKKMNFEED